MPTANIVIPSVTTPSSDPHYGTLGEANTYFSSDRDDSEAVWSPLSDIQKTRFLVMATNRIDRLNFIGSKAVSTQTLEFPRGTDTEVPETIEQAAYEIAYALADGRDPEYEQETANLTEGSFGGTRHMRDPKSRHIAYRHNIPSTFAWSLLQPFLRDGTSLNLQRVN